LTGVHALNLCDDIEITNRAIEFIQKLPNLDQLDVSWTQMDGNGLSKYSRLKKLTYLSVNRLPEANKILPVLEHSMIQDLHIQGCDLTDKDMVHLGRCDKLERIFMAGSKKVTLAGYAELANLKNLHFLDIREATPDADTISLLAHMPSLRTLQLSGVDDSLVQILAQSESLQNIEFGRCDGLTDKGVAMLAKMKHLRSFSLAESAATPRCIADLKPMPELRSITIHQDWLKEISMQEIKAQLPHCNIQIYYN
jgi:hypothetical protein